MQNSRLAGKKKCVCVGGGFFVLLGDAAFNPPDVWETWSEVCWVAFFFTVFFPSLSLTNSVNQFPIAVPQLTP